MAWSGKPTRPVLAWASSAWKSQEYATSSQRSVDVWKARSIRGPLPPERDDVDVTVGETHVEEVRR